MFRKYMFKSLVTIVLVSLALMSCDVAIENLSVGEGVEAEDLKRVEEILETEELEETQEMDETKEMGETEETAEMEDTHTPETTAMLGCYQIDFLEKTENMDGTITWTYQVMEVDCDYDLSYWVLELPGCVRVKSASPEPNELVKPDPNTDLYGVKWETGAGFEMGVFEVVTYQDWDLDERKVAAKGPDVLFGEIAGPTCGEVREDDNWDNDYWLGEDHSDDDMNDNTSYEDIYIPEGQYPPPGKCKLWDPKLDAGQQSEPMPCDCSYIEPGTFLINHEGEVVDCTPDEDGDGKEQDGYASLCMGLDIPYGQYPPPGECKLWNPDLDDGQQSKPIPCDCTFIELGTCLIDHKGMVVDCCD